MGPPPSIARVRGARRSRDPLSEDVSGIVPGAHPASSASGPRSRRFSGVGSEGFQGFLTPLRCNSQSLPDL